MGIGTSSSINKQVNGKFGSIHPEPNEKARPGYYFTTGKILYKGMEIPILPEESGFRKLKYGYLKSNIRVFYKGVSIPFANPVTFLTITRNNVNGLSQNKEKNNEFLKLNSVLGMDFVCNKKRIYFKTKIIHEE